MIDLYLLNDLSLRCEAGLERGPRCPFKAEFVRSVSVRVKPMGGFPDEALLHVCRIHNSAQAIAYEELLTRNITEAFEHHDCDRHIRWGAPYSDGGISGRWRICKVCDSSWTKGPRPVRHGALACGLLCPISMKERRKSGKQIAGIDYI